MDMSQGFPQFSLDMVTKTHLWWAFAVVLFIFAAVSAFMVFHWLNYGTGNFKIFIAQVLYWSVSVVLLLTMVVAIQLF